jgi:hypothetical protein
MILDSGTIIYVFNNLLQFINFHKTPSYHILTVGNHKVSILGYGNIHIKLKKLIRGTRTLWFRNTTFYTDFAINLVSFRLL